MQWTDEGIVLGVRRHSESAVVLELMTASHGRHLGLVRGGRSRRMQPVLQPGNRVSAAWRARLDEHLGTFTVEPLQHHAARLYGSSAGLYGLQALAAHLRLLPERDPHPRLFDMTALLVDHLEEPERAVELFLRFELMLLDEMGFGLDLRTCAATGTTQNLIYVSPKSGRAVSAEAGAPWASRLLALPGFLRDTQSRADAEGMRKATTLLIHFFERDIHGPRGKPPGPEREAFLEAAFRAMKAADKEPPNE
ncbi:DNA repair protein RecO [Notoacmeibacter ruber]|uniref:DNA repair protein RecO n=1 Tax=Notoacmeibacter ruber TaxID=2670375 RepID=A0A3L7JGI6_9HYPH|nr:DNA repair protein RecO [Notoacmeibacter ruber]RLQ87592.1 DNA repair protein RecO [Notoacmeibacter ruber]